MNMPSSVDRRTPRGAPWMAALALALAAVLAGPSQAAAGDPQRPAVSCSAPLGLWQEMLHNRARMIQAATVAMVVGIFILTRGRWQN